MTKSVFETKLMLGSNYGPTMVKVFAIADGIDLKPYEERLNRRRK